MTQNLAPLSQLSHEYEHVPASFLGGYTIDLVRRVIDAHVGGDFRSSAPLADALLRDPTVYAALLQRIGPLVGLPRTVNASTYFQGKGQSKRAADEAQRVVDTKLTASVRAPWYVSTATMGFAAAQLIWTPREDGSFVDVAVKAWPTECTFWNRWDQKYYATTREGWIEIERGTGKWLLFEPHGDESYRWGVLRAVALRVADRAYALVDRATHSQTVAAPTPVGTMPPSVTTKSPEGKAMKVELANLQNPRAGILMPHGADVKPFEARFPAHEVFAAIIDSDAKEIVRAILGQDATVEKGSTYVAPVFEGVRFDIVEQELECEHDELKIGLWDPWCMVNFGTTDVAPDVCADVPDARQAERSKEIAARHEAFNKAITAYKLNHFRINKATVAALAAQYNVNPPPYDEAAAAAAVAPVESETITAPV
jgi:phage gp29-like protein